MAIQLLSPDQVRTMSLEEKDRWWLKNVYKGNAPQLNVRSALTGMILGGALSLTNLYVGIRTGWSLGVGVTSVILSFAFYKLLARFKIGTDMTVLENNAMQSVATSAGYMTSPLISSMPAYMLITNSIMPMWHLWAWIVTLAILGVFFAFPLKKKYINDDQLPFPEGYASGIVLDSLHTEAGTQQGMFKVKVLLWGVGISALIETLRSEKVMAALRAPFLTLPEYWDDIVYKFATPMIMGTSLKDLTMQVDSSVVLFGTGGLMSMKSAMSMLLGAIINYAILAPYLISQGIIIGPGFKNITMWSLWGGAAMMTTSSLYSFFAKPKVFIEAYQTIFARKNRKKKQKDVLAHIELPILASVIAIPLIGAVLVWMGHAWFGIAPWLGVIAIPLVFVFTLIAVTSTGLTAITPGTAISKLTQITYSVLSPGNMATNTITAGISSDVTLSASNLLMDIKPGYMLGAKPRQQAIGHVLGILAGGLCAVPVFYILLGNDLSILTSAKMPMPSAIVYRAVAETLSKGLHAIHPTAQIALVVGALLGILFEFCDQKMKGRFPLSGIGLGLACVLRFTDSLSMALGCLLFWIIRQTKPSKQSLRRRVFVDNQETLSAGIVAGGALIGIVILILETTVLK